MENVARMLDLRIMTHMTQTNLTNTAVIVADLFCGKVGEVGMIKLIFDDWCWRCEKCNSMMALPGIVPSLEMLKEKGWKYCPVCGKKIDFKATEANKPDWFCADGEKKEGS